MSAREMDLADEPWSAAERLALAAWPLHEARPGFAARVLGRAEVVEGGAVASAGAGQVGGDAFARSVSPAAAPARGARLSFAAAAALALVLGGVWSMRLARPDRAGGDGDPGAPDERALTAPSLPAFYPPDGGLRPEVQEVQPAFDGVSLGAVPEASSS